MSESELVFNSAHWSDTGLPVVDTVSLETPAGMVVNVEASDEPPLRLGRCACNASDRQAEGDVPPRPDPNYGNSTGLFGSTPSGTDEQYDDPDAAEMEGRRAKLRQDLGLTTEQDAERARSKKRQEVDVPPVPGFPLTSRLAD
jgi:hypothetical protein